MKKGSITPFCALSLMLVASLLFALLELGRVYGLDYYASLKAETGIDSVCGEYQPYLWEKYGLLFLDGAYGTGQFSISNVSEILQKQISENLDTGNKNKKSWGMDLFSMSVGVINQEGYMLAADGEGEVFLRYIAEREKENLPLGAAEDFFELCKERDILEEEYNGIEESITDAQDMLDKLKQDWKNNAATQEQSDKEKEMGMEMPDTSELESVWGCVEEMQESLVLNLIFGETESVSEKRSMPQNNLCDRKKEEGTMRIVSEENWYRKLLVLTYLEEYFSDYRNQKDGHFLDYEMEYVIGGKGAEWENLEEVLKQLLMVREAANVAYLFQDEEKMALAETIAGLVGLMAGENPLVVETIKLGIIGAWAYLESILDVRALVEGDVIPLVKQENEWTTDVEDMVASFGENMKAKSCDNGLDYNDYLKLLLFLVNDKTLAYRMMEVMEIGMQSVNDYQNCRMDHMLIAMKYKVQFESSPMFCSLITVGDSYSQNFIFIKTVERSYIP